jgi:hypothetical protein
MQETRTSISVQIDWSMALSAIPPTKYMWRDSEFRHPLSLQNARISQKGGVLRELRKKEV